jgi:hypothetical protein
VPTDRVLDPHDLGVRMHDAEGSERALRPLYKLLEVPGGGLRRELPVGVGGLLHRGYAR